MKQQPTRRQAAALAGQRAHGAGLRDWMQRRISITARRARRAEDRGAAQRGTDRVPAHLRDQDRPVQWVHKHDSRVGPFTPYVNPDRNLKPSARRRLRKELRTEESR